MGAVVEKLNDDWRQLVGNVPIAMKSVTEFTIERTQRGSIYLGIIDKKHVDDQNSHWVERR